MVQDVFPQVVLLHVVDACVVYVSCTLHIGLFTVWHTLPLVGKMMAHKINTPYIF